MKHPYGFILDFDKIASKDIALAVGIAKGYENTADVAYVSWNPLGTYIYWWDGDSDAFYFTKQYVRIKGYNLQNLEDISKMIEFLSKFKTQ
jgi:hypothetical protein